MNALIIPSAPNWYTSSVIACAPDNTVVYAGHSNQIIVIEPREYSKAAKIRIIVQEQDCCDRAVGVSINYQTWGLPNKLIVCAYDENIVRIYSVNSTKTYFHLEHQKMNKGQLISVCFARERVISVTQQGYIIVWLFATDEMHHLSNIFGEKVQITCMSSCPHVPWLTAFGTFKGSIFVADLRRGGKLLNKLQQHNNTVSGLAWCPAPINIFEANIEATTISILKTKTFTPNETTDNKENLTDSPTALKSLETLTETKKEESTDVNIMEEITKIEIPRYGPRKENVYKKADTKNPWGNVVYNDSDEDVTERDLQAESAHDFLEECEQLREVILGNDDMFSENNENENIMTNIMKETMANITCDIQELHLKESCEIEQKDVSTIVTQKRSITGQPDKEYLLASTCTQGTICIWTTWQRGRLQLKINNFEKKRVKNNRIWSSIYWLKPDILLASGIKHEIYAVNFLSESKNTSKNNAKSYSIRFIHGDHSKQVCGITSPYKLYDSLDKTVNLHSLNEIKVWTVSHDRWVICSSVGPDRKTYASYPTFAERAEFFAVSPIDPYMVALGMYESKIRIWDLNNTQSQIFTMNFLGNVGFGNVVCLDWHPTKEYCLAFGTSKGSVGEVDPKNLSKHATIYNNYHSTNIYKIQWGPFPFSEELGLYSCSGGDLVVYNPTEPNADPLKIDIDNTSVTTFSWTADYTTLAVGSREGHVKLLSKDLLVYETLFRQKKSVQCLQWHPQSTANDSGLSPFCNYLAVSTNELDIYIYNCLPFNKKRTFNSSELIECLQGHNHRVKNLSWNTCVGGRLLSVSEKGLLHVWDVPSKIVIASNYVHRYCNSIWSPLVSNLVISFSTSGWLEIWDINTHLPMFETESAVTSEKFEKIAVTPSEVNESNVNAANKIAKDLKIMPRIGKLQQMQKLDMCKKLISLMANKQEESSDSEDDICPEESEVSVLTEPVQLFGNKKDALAILRDETQSHTAKHNWESVVHIGLWQGDLVNCLETAAKSGVINEWMIQVAPMVSHALYAELCEKYAEKLADNGKASQAASYYLLCHKVMNAIEVLCNSNLYREALILAKARLPSHDPTITNLYEKWAKYTTIVGNYEEAAQCLIKLGRLSEASEILNKRNNIDVLTIASDLAESTKNYDLFLTIKTKIESLKQLEEQNDSPVIHVSESRFDAVMQIKDNIAKIDNEMTHQDPTNTDETATPSVSTNDLQDPKLHESTGATDIKTN